MFAGGLGRIFTEFDTFLSNKATDKKSKKNKKKTFNLVENFVEEVGSLLSIDRAEFDKGNLPWSLIFYSRMLANQTILSQEAYNEYLETFSFYNDYHKEKKIKSNCSTVVKKLVDHLKLHHHDPDNALIGLSPSATITTRYNEWLANPSDHKCDAARLHVEQPADLLNLYNVHYPAKCGELVITQITLDQLKNNKDLRRKASLNSKAKIVIIARIKDAVQFNKKTYLNIWLTPREEQEVTVDADITIPVQKLIAGTSWIGNTQQMRELVADPYLDFVDFLKSEFLLSLVSLHDEETEGKILAAHTALKRQPVSFLYYHSVKDVKKIMDQITDQSPLYKTFIEKATEITKNELAKFIEEINISDGSSNKLFMPTCSQDLLKLNSMNFTKTSMEFLKEFQTSLSNAVNALKSERRELMKGNLKNQISKWWLLLIKTQTDILLLSQKNYNTAAWNEDNYIDQPPASIEGVRTNLQIVQDLINPKHPSHKEVENIIEEVKKEVYPVIDDFIKKSHVVLSDELFNIRITPENYLPEAFDLPKARKIFDRRNKRAKYTEEAAKQLDGLMKDLQYLVEMKNLENKSENDRTKSTAGKLELSYAVPLSGLVMGSFFRLENILKTVLELWEPKQVAAQQTSEAPPQPATPAAGMSNNTNITISAPTLVAVIAPTLASTPPPQSKSSTPPPPVPANRPTALTARKPIQVRSNTVSGGLSIHRPLQPPPTTPTFSPLSPSAPESPKPPSQASTQWAPLAYSERPNNDKRRSLFTDNNSRLKRADSENVGSNLTKEL